eukprot:7850356-Pyramimonas_sp.AAC.1
MSVRPVLVWPPMRRNVIVIAVACPEEEAITLRCGSSVRSQRRFFTSKKPFQKPPTLTDLFGGLNPGLNPCSVCGTHLHERARHLGTLQGGSGHAGL